MTRRSLYFLGAFMALGASAQAVEYTNSVLDLGVGARALGMGGANVSLADDSTATYWNPAGLVDIKHFELTAAEQGHESSALSLGANDVGSDYFFMSGGMTLPGVGSFGLSVMRFGVSGIQQTQAIQGGGVNSSTGDPFNILGSFGTADWGVFASYARAVVPAIDLGATVKMLYGGTNGLQPDSQDGITGDASYDYFGLDLGLKIKFGQWNPSLEGLNFGLNLQDLLNSGVKWSGTATSPSETVNTNPKIGLSYQLPFDFLKDAQTTVTLAADVDPSVYSPSTLVHYGAELWYKQVLAFRGGLMQFTDSPQPSEPSLGASFRIYILQVDYSYIYYTLTPIQYLDLSIRW